MAILQFNNINKSFAGEYILNDISFSIEEKDKIGLIGINGCGKTTLIKILLDEEEHDISKITKIKGNISKKNKLEIGYFSQHFNLNEENTIFEELMSVFSDLMNDYNEIQKINKEISKSIDMDKNLKKLSELSSRYEAHGGYSIEYKLKQVLNGINFDESFYNRLIKNLSGGQKSRVALAKLLIREPELLILDEPTNHLDLNAVEWLEKFLKSYNKSVLLVSHDRYFLDNVINKVFEVENKSLKMYKGNFTEFKIQKELILKGEIKAFEKEQEKVKKMEEFIRRYKAGVKAKQARGREKILNRMEIKGNPEINISNMKLSFDLEKSSSDRVFEANKISKFFSDKKLFENISFKIFKGDKIAIMGKNGVGKSTLLKILNERENCLGEIKKGERLKIAYYDQSQENLNLNNTILDEIRTVFPVSEEEARGIAGSFLFTDEDVFKKVSSLSGGEKARLIFLKLKSIKPNVLILDEPTNHLDIYSREVLEDALIDYDGTLILVSHDRAFLETVINKIYILKEDALEEFNGNYEEYKEENSKKPEVSDEENSKNDYEEQKRIKNRIKQLEKRYNDIEKEIEKLENKKENKNKEYEKAGKENNVENLIKYQTEIDELDEKILNLMEEWENIEKELEEIQ